MKAHGIKGLIFDLGNTLMYLDGEWDDVIRRGATDMAEFLLRQGFALDPNLLVDDFISLRKSLIARAREEQVEYTAQYVVSTMLGQLGYDDVNLELIEEAALAFFAYEESRWRAYSEADSTLRELAGRGYRLAVISNATDDALIQRLVDKGRLREWLHPVLSSAGVGIRKPHPAIFQRVLDQWGFSPSQVLMIGDMIQFDILGAHNAGLKGILAAWDLYPDFAEGSDKVVPDVRAESMSELIEVVSALDGQIAKGER